MNCNQINIKYEILFIQMNYLFAYFSFFIRIILKQSARATKMKMKIKIKKLLKYNRIIMNS
jgi:hypothetical protein